MAHADLRGVEVGPGDTVAYALARYSTAQMRVGKVLSIVGDSAYISWQDSSEDIQTIQGKTTKVNLSLQRFMVVEKSSAN